MGSFQAQEMLGLVQKRAALEWHLTSNHYPPVNLVFIDAALEAIELANQGDWDESIELPNGKQLTVSEVVEGLHLNDFLDNWEE